MSPASGSLSGPRPGAGANVSIRLNGFRPAALGYPTGPPGIRKHARTAVRRAEGATMGERPEEDHDEALSLLEEIEAAFRRMIVGIFRFLFVRLPTWFCELFQNFFHW